jgi:hypothetical protein
MELLMIFKYKRVVTLIIISLLVVYSIISNGIIAIKEAKYFLYRKAEDKITLYENKFQTLNHLLPEIGTIGYFTNKESDSSEKTKEFYLTQYILTPRIVVHSLGEQYILANVNNLFDPIEFCEMHKLKIVAISGNELFLFKKENQ